METLILFVHATDVVLQGFKHKHNKKESGFKKHFHDKGGKKGHFADHKSFGKHFKSGKGGGFKKGKFGVSI